MPPLSIDTGLVPARTSVPRAGLAADQASFSGVLARTSAHVRQTPEQKAREAAEQFVSIALVQPIFAQLRSSASSEGPFGMSQAEKQFRGLLDAEIAQRLVRRSNWPLVDRVARDLRGP